MLLKLGVHMLAIGKLFHIETVCGSSDDTIKALVHRRPHEQCRILSSRARRGTARAMAMMYMSTSVLRITDDEDNYPRGAE